MYLTLSNPPLANLSSTILTRLGSSRDRIFFFVFIVFKVIIDNSDNY